MKIALLNAPFTDRFCRGSRWQASAKGTALWPPIWLIYAAGALEKSGNKILLIDSPAKSHTIADVQSLVSQFQPALLVAYTCTASIYNDIEVINAIKKIAPQAKTCFVGPHVSVETDSTFAIAPNLDFIVRKEFDYVLRELSACLEKGSGVAQVKGLSYRADNGKVIHNPDAEYIQDLDELPFASSVIKEHLNYRDYHMDYLLYPFVQIYTGRGCPFECVFCLWPQTLMGRGYRRRSLDNVFAEIDYIKKELPGVKEIMIDDDTFTADRNRVKEFCNRLLAGNYKISWAVNARADITDLELLKLMKKSGCRCFVVGYESGSQAVLDNIHKRTNVEKMLIFAKLCKKAGIQVHGDFVLGLPGETRETIAETKKMILKLSPDTMQVAIAQPLPGTKFYLWAKENNYLKTYDFRNWLNAKGQQVCLLNYPFLKEEEILEEMYSILASYFLSPKFILRSLWKVLLNPKEAVKFYYAGTRFLEYLIKNRPSKKR